MVYKYCMCYSTLYLLSVLVVDFGSQFVFMAYMYFVTLLSFSIFDLFSYLGKNCVLIFSPMFLFCKLVQFFVLNLFINCISIFWYFLWWGEFLRTIFWNGLKTDMIWLVSRKITLGVAVIYLFVVASLSS